MSNYKSLASIIREMAGQQPSSAHDYRSIEATIRGMMRPQNTKPAKERIAGDDLSDDEVKHSRIADLQKKNKIIDNP